MAKKKRKRNDGEPTSEVDMFVGRVARHVRQDKGKSIRFLARRYGRALDRLDPDSSTTVAPDMHPAEFVVITIGGELLGEELLERKQDLRAAFETLAGGGPPDIKKNRFTAENAPLEVLVYGVLAHISRHGSLNPDFESARPAW